MYVTVQIIRNECLEIIPRNDKWNVMSVSR